MVFQVTHMGSSVRFIRLVWAGLTVLILAAMLPTARAGTPTSPSILGIGIAQVNDTIIWTSTVTPSGPPAPTGTITVSDGTGASCEITLPGTTCALINLTAGSKTATASYSGDVNYDPSVTSTVSYTVEKASTGLTLASSANPSAPGATVTFTATLLETPNGPSMPTGTVSFYDGPILLGTVPLSGHLATLTTSALSGGAHSLSASYNGDGSFSASTSAVLSHWVQIQTTLSMIGFGTTQVNAAIHWTTTVTPPGPPAPTGTVRVSDGTGSSCDITLPGTSCVMTNLTAGTKSTAAAYLGDGHYQGSLSGNIPYAVTKANTGLSLTSSADIAYVGSEITFTATVEESPDGPAEPTGTVSFYDGPTLLGTGPVTGNQALFTTNTLSAGTHNLIATYGGDANFNPSDSEVINQLIEKRASMTTFEMTPNPLVYRNDPPSTASPLPSANPNEVIFTVAVLGSGPEPTGSVSFQDGGRVLGSQDLIGGQATYPTTDLRPGIHEIQAIYSGDDRYEGSASPVVRQDVIYTPVPILGLFPLSLLALGLAFTGALRRRSHP